eukprot:scaffold770_cov109-Cylindrotheca_fusiformis.AAC.22
MHNLWGKPTLGDKAASVTFLAQPLFTFSAHLLWTSVASRRELYSRPASAMVCNDFLKRRPVICRVLAQFLP